MGIYHFKLCKVPAEPEDLGHLELTDDETALFFASTMLKELTRHNPQKYVGYAAQIFENIRTVRPVGRVTFDLETGEHQQEPER